MLIPSVKIKLRKSHGILKSLYRSVSSVCTGVQVMLLIVILFCCLNLCSTSIRSDSSKSDQASSTNANSESKDIDNTNIEIDPEPPEQPPVDTLMPEVITHNDAFSLKQLSSTGQDLEVVYQSPWTWRCHTQESVCKRELGNSSLGPRVPLDVCWLTCGKHGPLWPYPTIKTMIGNALIPFYPQNSEVAIITAPYKSVKNMLEYAGNILLDNLSSKQPNSERGSAFPSSWNGRGIESNALIINLIVQKSDTKISLDTDESYTLRISTLSRGSGTQVLVEIVGVTYFGVRHGLETLGQLIAFDDEMNCLQVVKEVFIKDRPKFRYRGMMIDSSRNFIPVTGLKKVVDAMSYNKMNVLHWHIADTNSFPFYSKRVPNMTTYGAYSVSQIYTPKDVKDLILYARLRGVKIIPELDAPAHAGNGWEWGSLMGLGDLALCVNAEPWRLFCGQPPCGQLNPLNNNTYIVLGKLYKDFFEVFDNDVFHMGGDEVFFQCWKSKPEIREWMKKRGSHDLMDLWGHFQDKAFKTLKEANEGKHVTSIVWTSDMTNRARQYLKPEDYIIQIWTKASKYEVRELLQNKYRVIFSNQDATYLDHGYGSWLGRNHEWTIKTWQNLYDNDLIKITQYHLGENSTYDAFKSGQILGGEAILWSEKVDEHNLEMKLWPRGAAFAERLWSSPVKRANDVYARLIHQRARMVKRGVHADRLQPESCHQLSGSCYDPKSRL